MDHLSLSASDREKYAGFESLDYEVVDNLGRRTSIWKISARERISENMSRWIATFFVGFITGFLAYLIYLVIRGIRQSKFVVMDSLIWENGDLAGGFFLFFFGNLLLSVSGSILVVYWEPAAAGSGIPEVKSYLNGTRVPKAFNIRTLIAKVIGVICSVASSLPVSLKGPMVHIGALVGASVSQGKSKTLGVDLPIFEKFRNPRDRRDFISSGAAAGVSAAFAAPVGGLLFSLEGTSSFWSSSLTWRTFFGCMVATFTANFFLSEASWTFREDSRILFRIDSKGLISGSYSILEIFPFIFIGIVGGLLGALFTWMNTKINMFRKKSINRTPKYRVIEVALISSIVSMLMYFIPFGFPCRVLSRSAEIDSVSRFFCPEGQYNELAYLMFISKEEALRALFSVRQITDLRPESLLIFSFFYFFLACYTLGAGISSGLVVPMLLIGSSYGRFFGYLMREWFGNVIRPGVYALVGASSMVGGITRMSMSFTVIILEITDSLEFLLPIMLSLMTAKLIGDRFTFPLYDILIEIKCIPFLEAEPSLNMEKLPIRHLMSSPVVKFYEKTLVEEIIVTLGSTKHGSFPVVDKTSGELRGTIRRKDLVVLLARRVFRKNPHEIFPPDIFLKMVQAFDYSLDDVVQVLDPVDLSTEFNLSRYMHRSPVIVYPQFLSSTVFRIIRSLGLRHIVVVDSLNCPIGVVSRKDLIPSYVSEVSKAVWEGEGIVTKWQQLSRFSAKSMLRIPSREFLDSMKEVEQPVESDSLSEGENDDSEDEETWMIRNPQLLAFRSTGSLRASVVPLHSLSPPSSPR